MNVLKNTIILLSVSAVLFSSAITDKTLDEIKQIFPNSVSINHSKYKLSKESIKNIQNTVKQKFFRSELNLWIIIDQDSSKYYGILDNVKGKSLPITFLTIFNNSAQVHYSTIIKYREGYGGEVGNRRWLNQFNTYTDSSIYKVGNDISGITGATISVHSITKGIRKLSYLIHEIITENE